MGEELHFADMQYSSEVPANSCDICTHSLENVKTVLKKCATAIEKTGKNNQHKQILPSKNEFILSINHYTMDNKIQNTAINMK